jgi:hypothetical protein
MMKRPEKRRSKRHPLLRFIRSVYRLLRVFFRPTRKKARTSLSKFVHTSAEAAVTTEDSILAEEPVARKVTDSQITVGELFGLVQWQSPSSIKLRSDAVLQPKRNSVKAARSIILNTSQAQQIDSQITVGKLFGLVQWQFSTSTGLGVGSGAKTEDSLSDSSLN